MHVSETAVLELLSRGVFLPTRSQPIHRHPTYGENCRRGGVARAGDYQELLEGGEYIQIKVENEVAGSSVAEPQTQNYACSHSQKGIRDIPMQRWDSDFGRRRVKIARPAPPAGAVDVRSLTADRNGATDFRILRASGRFVGCFGSAGT